MAVFNPNNPLKAYQQVGVSDTNYADPHRLICQLMDGALNRLSKAKGAIQQKHKASTGELTSSAITIIDGLKTCLDMDAGGELSNNLADLYDYMCRRILLANAQDDAAILDEVCSLLKEIKFAWEAIPQQVRESHQQNETQVPSTNAG